MLRFELFASHLQRIKHGVKFYCLALRVIYTNGLGLYFLDAFLAQQFFYGFAETAWVGRVSGFFGWLLTFLH
jgi:hypothetical protein